MGNVKTKEIALPWQWLELSKTESLSRTFGNWSQVPTENFNIRPGDYWGVWDLNRFVTVGISVDDKELASRLRSGDSLYEFVKSYNQGKFELTTSKDLDRSIDNSFKLFLGLIGMIGDFATQVTLDNIARPVALQNLSRDVSDVAIASTNFSQKLIFVERPST